MPHLVLAGRIDLAVAARATLVVVHRWGRSVLKTEGAWLRPDGGGLLIEGVVVEHSRPLHPVALIADHRGDTMVRLWPRCHVERTRPVQRWLALLARHLQQLGGGAIVTTNIAADVLAGIELEFTDGASGPSRSP